MAFLLECLEDIDTQLWYHGGRLNLVEGEPAAVIKELSKHFAIQRICFDQVAEKIPKLGPMYSMLKIFGAGVNVSLLSGLRGHLVGEG